MPLFLTVCNIECRHSLCEITWLKIVETEKWTLITCAKFYVDFISLGNVISVLPLPWKLISYHVSILHRRLSLTGHVTYWLASRVRWVVSQDKRLDKNFDLFNNKHVFENWKLVFLNFKLENVLTFYKLTMSVALPKHVCFKKVVIFIKLFADLLLCRPFKIKEKANNTRKTRLVFNHLVH